MRNGLGRLWETLTLPAPARRLRRSDHRGLPESDPGAERAVNAMLAWLGRAQDRSGEGGFSAHFDLIHGWGGPSAAVTGIATRALATASTRWSDPSLVPRTARGLEWLTREQRSDGGFLGEHAEAADAFTTAQALLGLLAGHDVVAGARQAAERAARHLVSVQNADGSWGDGKVHYTQIAWALQEADALFPGQGFAEAAGAGLRWALGQQQRNGWLAHCGDDDPAHPLTVAIGQAVHGFLEAYRLGKVLRHLDAAVMSGWALVAVQRRDDGSLPGRLNEKWEASARWSGLAGDAKAAICWMLLLEATQDQAFASAARAANRFIRRTLPVTADADQAGGVRGSFPVDGGYGRFRYMTAAAVYAIESNMMELALDGRSWSKPLPEAPT